MLSLNPPRNLIDHIADHFVSFFYFPTPDPPNLAGTGIDPAHFDPVDPFPDSGPGPVLVPGSDCTAPGPDCHYLDRSTAVVGLAAEMVADGSQMVPKETHLVLLILAISLVLVVSLVSTARLLLVLSGLRVLDVVLNSANFGKMVRDRSYALTSAR